MIEAIIRAEWRAILTWYAALVGLGWGSFPLAALCFRRFPDRGFALAKTLGLVGFTYLVWIAVSTGLLTYHSRTVWCVFVGYLLGNLAILLSRVDRVWGFLAAHVRRVLLIESLFLLVFLAGVIIRMYNPDLTGAEKEADLTFLNAVLHSTEFPPKDPWFAGETVNYYYFGYVIWATMLKLTGIAAPVGFNLALATILALAAATIFGLVYAFTRRVRPALLAVGLLCVFGNLDGSVQVLEKFVQTPLSKMTLLPFDWWRSSRVIPDTINEFPYFSFLLGDLHAHFMAIPVALLLIAFLCQWLQAARTSASRRYKGLLMGFIALTLGAASVTNGWDFPTYLILSGLCLAVAQPRTNLLRDSAIVVGLLVAVFGLSRLLFLPLYQHFTPQLNVTDLRLVPAAQRTGIADFLTIYGLFLWLVVGVIGSRVGPRLSFSSAAERQTAFLWGNILLLAVVLGYVSSATWVLPLSALLSGYFLYALYRSRSGQEDETAFAPMPEVLLFLAFAITAGCEIVYIKDFYGHPLERQNTIFKFYYQAWILLAVATPCLIAQITRKSSGQRQRPRLFKWLWKPVFIVLCSACCVYPLLATYDKTNRFRDYRRGGLPYVPTLNGIRYIQHRYPDEYTALRWIQEHLDEDAVIVEATGRPYSFFGRVATTTGRSTVLGWGNHEALWRDQTWRSITQRTDDIRQIYSAIDKQTIRPLLDQYGADYVYVGVLERELYEAAGLQAFDSPGFERVYANGAVSIYQKS
jgi:YYY domain-containing protein